MATGLETGAWRSETGERPELQTKAGKLGRAVGLEGARLNPAEGSGRACGAGPRANASPSSCHSEKAKVPGAELD